MMDRHPGSPTETVLAGGGVGDFATVRHLRVAGSQRWIGQVLATTARRVHGAVADPRPARSAAVQRARRRWFAVHYPIMNERIEGFADALGIDPASDELDLAMLGTYQLHAGCSAVFHPPPRTRSGRPLLGRNFDFPTVSYSQVVGLPPSPGELPLAADPWVIELHPDGGYSSVTIGIMDVVGAMDGINSAGLTVALLADDESPAREPAGLSQVGLSEQQIVRYLLDTCATADQARQALLIAKQYYVFVPCHFLVADASGDAFVWEHSPGRNLEHLVEAEASSFVCTNHLLHRWPDPDCLPDDDRSGVAGLTFQRWRTLDRRARHEGPVDADLVRDQLADVAFTTPMPEVRTLWRAVYDLATSSVDVSFFLRDVGRESRYSPNLRFTLPSRP